MTDDTKSRAELLVQSRWFLLAAGLLALLAFSLAWWLLDLSVPSIGRELKLFVLAFAIASVLALPWATRLVDWLHTPNTKYILDYNAETDELSLWEIPAPQWRTLEVEEEIYQLNASEPVYEGRNYDPEENTVEGVWRGSATDLELVETREAVKEVRGDLEEIAREGLAIRAKQSSIVRAAVSDIVMQFVADFEEDTTYSGEQIQQRVDDALAELDQDDDPDDQDDDEPTGPLLESLAQTNGETDTQNDGNQ